MFTHRDYRLLMSHLSLFLNKFHRRYKQRTKHLINGALPNAILTHSLTHSLSLCLSLHHSLKPNTTLFSHSSSRTRHHGLHGVQARKRGHRASLQGPPPSHEGNRLRAPPTRCRPLRLLPFPPPHWLRPLHLRRRRTTLRLRPHPRCFPQQLPTTTPSHPPHSPTLTTSPPPPPLSTSLQPFPAAQTRPHPTPPPQAAATEATPYSLRLEPLLHAAKPSVEFSCELLPHRAFHILLHPFPNFLRLELGKFLPPSTSSRFRLLPRRTTPTPPTPTPTKTLADSSSITNTNTFPSLSQNTNTLSLLPQNPTQQSSNSRLRLREI